MHIVFIPSASFSPEHGCGIIEFHQAKALQKLGHQIGIISSGYHPWKKAFFTPHPPLSSLLDNIPIYKKEKRPIIPQRFINALGQHDLREEYQYLFETYIAHHGKPDIIHAHNSLFAGNEAQLISDAYNIPFVITEHDSSHARGLLNDRLKQISSNALRHAKSVIAVSSFQKKQIVKLTGQESDHIHVIANIIDPGLEQATNQRLKTKKQGHLRFITIGSLDKNKNQDAIINGFASYHSENSQSHLVIVGDGGERGRLIRLCHSLNIEDDVTFCGHIDREDLVEKIQQSDIYIHASNIETFGVSMIEALYFGKPVITSRSGGPEDFITKNNGVWLESLDNQSIQNAMRFMAEHRSQFDPRTISKDIASKFGSKTISLQLLKIYEDAFMR